MQVSMGKLADKETEKGSMHMRWRLNATGPNDISNGIKPGIYALQNKQSGTYVSLSPDESSVSCWPEGQLEKTGVKLVCALLTHMIAPH